MKLTVLLAIAFAGVTFAQGPPLRQQARFDEVKAYLGLTDTNIQQIQAAQKQAMDSTAALMTQIHTKEIALRDLLDKGTADAATVGKAMLEIQALGKQVQQSRDAAHTAIVGLVPAKDKLKALEDASKLQPAIQQAMQLGLLTPPDPAAGGPMRGPGGMGMGPGFGPGPGMGMGMGMGMGRGRGPRQ